MYKQAEKKFVGLTHKNFIKLKYSCVYCTKARDCGGHDVDKCSLFAEDRYAPR